MKLREKWSGKLKKGKGYRKGYDKNNVLDV
jgi:hypothetical protein